MYIEALCGLALEHRRIVALFCCSVDGGFSRLWKRGGANAPSPGLARRSSPVSGRHPLTVDNDFASPREGKTSFSKAEAACFCVERERWEDLACRSTFPGTLLSDSAWLQSASSSWTLEAAARRIWESQIRCRGSRSGWTQFMTNVWKTSIRVLAGLSGPQARHSQEQPHE